MGHWLRVTTLLESHPEAINMTPIITALRRQPDYHAQRLLSVQHEPIAVEALRPTFRIPVGESPA
jgi:hypothetical protein